LVTAGSRAIHTAAVVSAGADGHALVGARSQLASGSEHQRSVDVTPSRVGRSAGRKFGATDTGRSVVEAEAAIVSATAPILTLRRLLQFTSLLVDGPLVVAAFVIGLGPEVAILVIGMTLMIWGPKSPAVLERHGRSPLRILGTLGRWRMRATGAVGSVIFLVAAALAAPLPPARASVLVMPPTVGLDVPLSASARLVGNITYATYGDSACTRDRQERGRAAFSDGVVPPSRPTAFSTDGTYWWRAELSGSSGSSLFSSCTPLVVGTSGAAPAASSGPFQLALSRSPVERGSDVTAQALLPTTATFALYRARACEGSAQVIPGAGVGTIVTSRPIELIDAGDYSWRAAVQLGEHEISSTSCVAMAVPKRTPSLTASPITAARIAVAAPASITFEGASAHATGEIRFTLYSDSSCSSAVGDAGSVPATRGSNVGPTASVAGSYYWRATYAGDASNESAIGQCAPITVAKNHPTITLIVSGTLPADRSIGAAARLVGASPNAAGTARLVIFRDNACTDRLTQTPALNVSGGVLPGIAPFEKTGDYPTQIVYDGDANNDPTTSACVVVKVVPAVPSLSARLNAASVAIGVGVRASAQLTLATASASGTLTYGLFNDEGCAGAPVVNAGGGAVSGGQNVESEHKTFGNAGTAYWKATYSGDGNNGPAASACLPLTVTPSSPTVSLTLARSSVPIGVSAAASVALLGATPSAGGTVKYTLYNDSSCTVNPPVDAGTKNVVNDRVPDSDPISFGSTGTAYWQAVYSGDANNRSAASPCAALSVTKATPSIVALPSSVNVTVGDTITVGARLSGISPSPGGTVSYVRATDSACRTTTAISAQPVGATLVGTRSNGTTLSTVGTVYVQATYAGDGNNASASSDCVAITVRQWVDPCGAPSNPFHYSFCGSAVIFNIPSGFCTYFSCISTFGNGRGYIIQCSDGTFSNSGGISGSCSGHGGNRRALYAP